MSTKKCPYCGEEIQTTAKKCRHCGEWLEPTAQGQQPFTTTLYATAHPTPPITSTQGKRKVWKILLWIFVPLLAIILLLSLLGGEDNDEQLAQQMHNSTSSCAWRITIPNMGTMYWQFKYVPDMEVISWLHVGGTFTEYFKLNDLADGELDTRVEVLASITGRWGVMNDDLTMQYDLSTLKIVDYTYGFWLLDVSSSEILKIARETFTSYYASLNSDDEAWLNLQMAENYESFTFETADYGRVRATLDCSFEDNLKCRSGDKLDADDIINMMGY